MGTVYRARHRSLGELRAIKIVRADLDVHASAVELFLQEARSLLRLQHEAIVRCHDLLRDEHGRFYLVMELVEGPSLAERLREGPLGRDELRALLLRMVEGLRAAHRCGVVHRDVSPENIVLAAGHATSAKLIDFGLARDISSTDATTADTFSGKLGFASPEQFGLFGGRIDHRSDLYSLGLVIAQAASGQPVFAGQDLARMIEARERRPLLPAALPQELRGVVHSLLEPDPRDRPASAAELIQLLEYSPPGAPAARSRAPRASAASVLTGREGELRDWAAALDRVRRGASELHVLAGDAGIGKTSLATAFLTHAAKAGLLTASARCSEHHQEPYAPIVDLLRALLASKRRSVPDWLRPALLPLAASAPDLGRLLASPQDTATEIASPVATTLGAPEAVLRPLVALLREWSSCEPIILFLDDIQWADPQSLEVLRLVARPLTSAPDRAPQSLGIVATLREGEQDPPRLHTLLRELEAEGVLVTTRLERLADAEVRQLLRGIDATALPDEAIGFVATRSQGNPLLAVEMYRELATRGWDSRRALRLPPRVLDVIDIRLRRLSSECQEALCTAAVLGLEFDIDVVAQTLALEPDALLDRLDPAQTARLIDEVPESGGLRYRFEHVLMAQALVERLRPTRRRRLHAALARALDALRGDADDAAGEIAHHLVAAGPCAPAEATVRFARRAGDRALLLSAASEAGRLYGAALVAARRGGAAAQGIAELQCALALTRGRQGKIDAARALFDTALPELDRLPDPIPAARARASLGWLLIVHADHAAALRYLGAALQSAPALAPELYGEILALYANALENVGSGGEVREIAEKLAELAAGSDNHGVRDRARQVRSSWYANTTADFPAAQRLTRDRLEDSFIARSQRERTTLLDDLGFLHFLTAELDSSLALSEQALESAVRLGEPAALVDVRALRAVCFAFRGEWARVDEECGLALPELGSIPGSMRQGLLIWSRTRRDLWLGGLGGEIGGPEIYRGMAVAARSMLAGIAYVASESSAPSAEALLREVETVHPPGGAGLNWLIVTQALAAGWANLGRAPEAARWYAELAPYEGTLYLTLTSLVRARIAELENRPAEWREHLSRALATCRRQKLRPLLVISLLAEARRIRACAEPGYRDAAQRVLDEAHTIHAELGMALAILKDPSPMGVGREQM